MSTATWPVSLPTIARLAAPLAAAVLAAACAQSAPPPPAPIPSTPTPAAPGDVLGAFPASMPGHQRHVVKLPPLDNDLEGYIEHKFARFDLRPEDVFEPDAFNALRARLIRTPRGAKAGEGAVSTCYPLAVHNLVARAMNAAAAAGWPKVDAQCVAGA